MERYFDLEYTLDDASRWGSWLDRHFIEGLSTSDSAYVDPWSGSPFAPRPGSSACIKGWRGSVQLVLNPVWTDRRFLEALASYRYPPEVIASIKWTHWNDLGSIYPQDENGFALNTWDNVGVQYGLRALKAGAITTQEFLDINACVGGWKSQEEMVLGKYPWDPDADISTFDPWDQSNMNLSPSCKSGGPPAPRTRGSITAMRAAYRSGHVFEGRLDIPVFDIRHYLEPVLDMHHTQASFASRARMVEARGHADNQVIWFVACELDPIILKKNCPYDPTGDVLDIIDEWMSNHRCNFTGHVLKNKPAAAVDACFNEFGSVIYSGPDAWDGILNDNPDGQCATAFPISSTSRVQAGGSIKDDILKCALKPVTTALNDGTYGNAEVSDEQRRRLHAIFPSGVCDHSRPDVGKPRRSHRHKYRRKHRITHKITKDRD